MNSPNTASLRVYPVPPCARFLETLFFAHNAKYMDATNLQAPKLLPVTQVALLLGYRDARNFRLAVAPRLALPVFRVGLRWFAGEADVRRIVETFTAHSPSPQPEPTNR